MNSYFLKFDFHFWALSRPDDDQVQLKYKDEYVLWSRWVKVPVAGLG